MNPFRKTLDFVFPFLCPGCQQIGASPGFCPACWKNLDFIHAPFCALCGEPFSMVASPLCSSCRAWIPRFTSHRSLWRYGPLSRKIIFALKYGRQRYLAALIAEWLVPLALPLSVDYIVPVPLHPKRLAQRGFNQSALIAKHLSKLTGIPLCLNHLKRVIGGPPQGSFSSQRRYENVDGAFSCAFDFGQTSVLLIDDVYTTGATLSACVGALHEAGAHHVHGLTLAKVVLG